MREFLDRDFIFQLGVVKGQLKQLLKDDAKIDEYKSFGVSHGDLINLDLALNIIWEAFYRKDIKLS